MVPNRWGTNWLVILKSLSETFSTVLGKIVKVSSSQSLGYKVVSDPERSPYHHSVNKHSATVGQKVIL